jgi:hypothetical protein
MRQQNMSSQTTPAASLYLRILLTLMLISVTLPIFAGYLAGFLLFCWIVFEQVKGRLSIMSYLRGQVPEPVFDRKVSRPVMSPAMASMFMIFGGLVLAGLVGSFTSSWSGSAGKTVHVLLHQMVKLVLLGTVSSIALLESVRRGAGTRYLAQAFAIWLAVLFVYCLVQRYTGIDLSHGWSARLGPHRFAYGVYRVSGFMGHPLTFTYNLMVIALGSAALAIRQFRLERYSPEFRLWSAVLALSMLTILISGSRFVLIVLVMVPLFCELRRIIKYWKYALAACVLLGAGLWLEGSVAGRFSEFFVQNQNLEERFPRLVFWKIHWQMFLDHPVAGVTLSGLSEATASYYHASGIHDKIYTAHNVFLQFLADSGLIGFAGLVAFFVGYLKSTIASVEAEGRSTGLSYLFVATLLVSLQQNVIRDSEYLLAFWFFTALQFTRMFRTGPSGDTDKRKPTQNIQPATGREGSAADLSGQPPGHGANGR